jgi:primosomal protein N' (replication factor Y)
MKIARIALDVPVAKLFDFLLPADVTGDVTGYVVVVPFGNKRMAGVIVEQCAHSDVPDGKLKAIIHLQDQLPHYSARDFALLRFCENYYHHPLGPIALSALPPAMRVTKAVSPKRPRIIAITPAGLAAMATLPARAVAQRAMLEALSIAPQSDAGLRARHERAGNVLATLLARAWVTREVDAPSRVPAATAMPAAPGPALNADQEHAVAAINAAFGTFTPFLLAGITGSGKTEVYLRAIAEVMRRGRQALVLVPEINLTPQFLRQVEARFPAARIAALHSGLADMARLTSYLDAQSGRADIVIGTRLAAFVPMSRLGIIVVDEEHDASFKQQEGFRYSARDVAVFRAQTEECPVILGSATPSLESLQNVARHRFTELKLTRRATPNALLPGIDFIDLNRERAEDGLSSTLVGAIQSTVRKGEQALVFINRRGYSPALVCAQCGTMPECKRCSARLVFHQREKRLKCHHCGFQTRVPPACESCGSHDLVPAGQGTERVEAALRTHLPTARIARVDRDSTRRRGSAEKIFDAAAAGDIDVLVGTQMLSKGHDFPKLTLVGVVNADAAMFSADFRAAERMVAQLMQVSGRAGRADLPGRVLIQTRFATHPLYQAVALQDHGRFAAMALAEREHAHLPPFTFLALLRAEAKSVASLEAFMEGAADAARTQPHGDGLHVWDPVAAPLSRKAGYERRQLMLQADSRRGLQQFLASWLPKVRALETRAVKWVIDVDPLDV